MIQKTFVIGFNHHRSDISVRSHCALNDDLQHIFYQKALKSGLSTLCILNTCNRTEVYGHGNVHTARGIYAELLQSDATQIPEYFEKTGIEAVEHIFKVASGLDSQVIGDLEILGQFKQAFHTAKKHQALNGFFERLANQSIQAAKEVRSQTRISSGTVSVAYAAVSYIKNVWRDHPLNVLLVGTGSFGKNIALNVKDYLPNARLLLCNRTLGKAEELAEKLNAHVYPFDALNEAIKSADVVISSVNNSKGFLINSSNLCDTHARLFLDMSVPLSIDPSLECIEGIRVVGVDEVSKMIKDTLEVRKVEIPLAESILNKHLGEFGKWVAVFEKSDSLQEWKTLMERMSQACPHMSQLQDAEKNRIIGKSMSEFVRFLRQKEALPRETEKIIAHFLHESEKAMVCRHTGLPMTKEELEGCKSCSGEKNGDSCNACPVH